MRPPTIPTTIPVKEDDSKQTVIMKSLYNTLIEHREPKTGRALNSLFMCLPSRKDFPEYFKLIAKPIALNKIRERIEKGEYADELACMDDFKLMFSNCKHFNEDDSQIYKDAVLLESLLDKKLDQLNQENNRNNNSNSNNNSNNNNHAKHVSPNNSTTNIEQSPINNKLQSQTKQNDLHQQQKQHSQQNGTVDKLQDGLNSNHNHHNEASMDSSSNLSVDLTSTPVEKCSLNTRRGRNSDAPKRQLLTGYIIYASEIRKQVIDKNPNQNFGDISRLVGNEWKALPHDIRSKYDQRALIHNKRVRERAQRDLNSSEGRLSNGLHTPKLTKRKLAKLAKEQMRQHHLSYTGNDDSSSIQSPRIIDEHSTSVSQVPRSVQKQLNNQQQTHTPQQAPQATSSKTTTAESSTQTIAIRFVEPTTAKKRLVYSESFRKYIESMQVPNKDLLVEETAPIRTPELPTDLLGAGVGRYESPEAALWALRDFMLQDAVTMRRSLEPYL